MMTTISGIPAPLAILIIGTACCILLALTELLHERPHTDD